MIGRHEKSVEIAFVCQIRESDGAITDLGYDCETAFETVAPRDRIDFVLCYGRQSEAYYARRGFTKNRIYPFLYQNERSQAALPQPTSEPTAAPRRVLFSICSVVLSTSPRVPSAARFTLGSCSPLNFTT